VAGGFESMTRAPWVMEKPRRAWAKPGAVGNADVQGGEQVAGRLGDVGALAEGADRSGEDADADSLQLAAHGGLGLPCLVLGDADKQEREPAEQDVGADALLTVAPETRSALVDTARQCGAGFSRAPERRDRGRDQARVNPPHDDG
jgi:hypothetical protein